MRPVLIAGIAGVILGFIAILDRGIAGMFDLGYLFVTFLGIIAGVIGVYHLNRRHETPRRLSEFDDPERRYQASTPGDDLDRRLETISIERRVRGPQQHIRDRIRNAAIRSLIIHAGYDPTTAERAVDDGTWTDDPVAASFLAKDQPYPPQLRVKAFFGRVDISAVGADRTIEAITAVIES